MAEIGTVVFTASIENEEAIRRWTEEVAALARGAQEALDDLSHKLAERPHVSITLNRAESERAS